MPFLLACLLLFSAPTQAEGPAANAKTQTELIAEAARLNQENSDRSLEQSTILAMNALGKLASYNIPGAVQTGFEAYGKYSNSVHMDNLEFANRHNAWKMSSVSGGNPGPEPKLYYTSYGRLNPNFLEQSEAKKAGEEFEKATGMKAKKLLEVMSYFADNPIHPSDPEIFRKMRKQADFVIDRLPDSTLTTSLKKVRDTVPEKIMKETLEVLLGKFWKEKPAQNAKITAEASKAKIEERPVAESAGPEVRTLAQAPPISEPREGAIFPNDAKPSADPNLASVFQLASSPSAEEEKSLFVRVSTRIRGRWKEF